MAQALVEGAQEHFAFFSADGIDGEPLSPGDVQVQAAGGPGVQADLQARFPLLGAGVVQAALQAGVTTSNLEQMQKLLSPGKPGAKVGDLDTKVLQMFSPRTTARRKRFETIQEKMAIRVIAIPW